MNCWRWSISLVFSVVLATTTTKGSVLSVECLRAKPGRPKVKGNDEKTKVVGNDEKNEVVSRLCSMRLEVDMLCPSHGHSNDLREASNYLWSEFSKGGKSEVKPTTPCPTCGHLNESKRASCSMCECALIGKVGRLSSQVESTTVSLWSDWLQWPHRLSLWNSEQC